jgi:dTMP kinase
MSGNLVSPQISTMGMLVAIEGTDGSGKGTQAQMLLDRARESRKKAELLSFPRYKITQSSKWIAEYLGGDYGTLQEVDPLFAGMMFALDRFESKGQIKDLLAEHDLVIMDRYVESNLAYQSARVNEGGRTKLLDRLLKLEYEIYGLPRPNLTLFLDMPVAFSEHLISERGARAYTADDGIIMDMADQVGIPPGRYDIHEENTEYLHAVHKMYYQLIKSFDMHPCEVINCQNGDGGLRDRKDIAQEVWIAVEAKLNEAQ